MRTEIAQIRELVKTGTKENILIAFELGRGLGYFMSKILADFVPLLGRRPLTRDYLIALFQQTELDLSNSGLSELPPILFEVELPKMRHLNLSNNHLQALPSKLGELSQLETLNLNHNKLTDLPSAFANLEDLFELKLTNNQFNRFPSALYSLKKLGRLHMASNSLNFFPSKVLEMGTLGFLDLRYNGIAKYQIPVRDRWWIKL
ncbi:MAG: leucine-rich repeat domain-containing protein [Aureispira sp.]|nr:leucine-rich repeat domain-containing protein [Aureispira sp.]